MPCSVMVIETVDCFDRVGKAAARAEQASRTTWRGRNADIGSTCFVRGSMRRGSSQGRRSRHFPHHANRPRRDEETAGSYVLDSGDATVSPREIGMTRNIALGVLFLAFGLRAGTAVAAEATGDAAPPSLAHSDLEAYFDGFLPFALQRADIAGAVVVVVKDGQTLFQKGYGYADSRSGRPVDPDLTLFRPGSISKLFTWTAVMQLVEAGKVDLDRDINDYLDFRIPSTFDRPITLRHLVTHTAGFEDTYKNILMKDAQSTPSIETYVKNTVPPRLFPPG